MFWIDFRYSRLLSDLILFELNNEYDTGCSALGANPRLLISLVLLLLFETGVFFKKNSAISCLGIAKFLIVAELPSLD
jgi:hypothetical protein